MKKVITYGTFDLFHQGHYNILRRAKEQGDYLIVGVTSESYDIERGKLSVKDSLTTRINNVMATGFVDEVIIEEYLGQKIRDIIKYDIDVFVIGDDWRGKFDHLSQYCDIVYLERTKNISSTQIREESGNVFRIGIVTDDLDDDRINDEVRFVSGLHVQKAFCEDAETGRRFCEKFSIDSSYTDFDLFTEGIDIVIVCTAMESREHYTRLALNAGKHVIAASPVTMDPEVIKELSALSHEKNVALIENITTVYLRAFTQLLWMVQGDIIGDIHSVRCSMSSSSFENKKDYLEMETLGVTIMVKFLGTEFDNVVRNLSRGDDGNIRYSNIFFTKGGTVGNIEIADGIELKDELVIVGENSRIVVKDDWWDTGYFELKAYDRKYPDKYSYNFEGTGFRYILQELLIMLRDRRSECTRLFDEESEAIVRILSGIEGQER